MSACSHKAVLRAGHSIHGEFQAPWMAREGELRNDGSVRPPGLLSVSASKGEQCTDQSASRQRKRPGFAPVSEFKRPIPESSCREWKRRTYVIGAYTMWRSLHARRIPILRQNRNDTQKGRREENIKLYSMLAQSSQHGAL